MIFPQMKEQVYNQTKNIACTNLTDKMDDPPLTDALQAQDLFLSLDDPY